MPVHSSRKVRFMRFRIILFLLTSPATMTLGTNAAAKSAVMLTRGHICGMTFQFTSSKASLAQLSL